MKATSSGAPDVLAFLYCRGRLNVTKTNIGSSNRLHLFVRCPSDQTPNMIQAKKASWTMVKGYQRYCFLLGGTGRTNVIKLFLRDDNNKLSKNLYSNFCTSWWKVLLIDPTWAVAQNIAAEAVFISRQNNSDLKDIFRKCPSFWKSVT